jgi:hypothetical protein
LTFGSEGLLYIYYIFKEFNMRKIGRPVAGKEGTQSAVYLYSQQIKKLKRIWKKTSECYSAIIRRAIDDLKE